MWWNLAQWWIWKHLLFCDDWRKKILFNWRSRVYPVSKDNCINIIYALNNNHRYIWTSTGSSIGVFGSFITLFVRFHFAVDLHPNCFCCLSGFVLSVFHLSLSYLFIRPLCARKALLISAPNRLTNLLELYLSRQTASKEGNQLPGLKQHRGNHLV